MTREEFISLAKSPGYWYSDEDIADILSQLDDKKEELSGVTTKELTLKMANVSSEEEWIDYYAENFLVHY